MKDATNDSMKKYYGKFPHSVSLTIKRNRLLLFPCLSLRSVITLAQYPCVPHSISRLQHIVVRKYKIHNTHVLLNCFHRLSDRPSKFLVAWHNLRHATDTNPRHYLQYKMSHHLPHWIFREKCLWIIPYLCYLFLYSVYNYPEARSISRVSRPENYRKKLILGGKLRPSFFFHLWCFKRVLRAGASQC